MNQPPDSEKTPQQTTAPAAPKPIKVPNPPEEEIVGKVPAETPKVGSRDAPGG